MIPNLNGIPKVLGTTRDNSKKSEIMDSLDLVLIM